MSWLELNISLCVCGLYIGVVATRGGLGVCSGSMDLNKNVGCKERKFGTARPNSALGARVKDLGNYGRDLS